MQVNQGDFHCRFSCDVAHYHLHNVSAQRVEFSKGSASSFFHLLVIFPSGLFFLKDKPLAALVAEFYFQFDDSGVGVDGEYILYIERVVVWIDVDLCEGDL